MARKHKFIKQATANAHGQFRAKAQAAGKSTAEFAREHEHSPGKLGKQARLAETLMKVSRHHHSRDRYKPVAVQKG
jgi:hypothetical protein